MDARDARNAALKARQRKRNGEPQKALAKIQDLSAKGKTFGFFWLRREPRAKLREKNFRVFCIYRLCLVLW